MKYIKEKKYRRMFLNIVNEFRLSGVFSLSEKSFYTMGDLFLFCLDEVYMNKDYESARICLNLSGALYKSATEPNKPRIFLQAIIEQHHLWKMPDFWREFLKCKYFLKNLVLINEELHSQKTYNIYTFEANNKDEQIRKTVINILSMSVYNMTSFELPKPEIEKLFKEFTNYYSLTEEEENTLIDLVKAQKPENKVKVDLDRKTIIEVSEDQDEAHK